jgi:hypothetical protein
MRLDWDSQADYLEQQIAKTKAWLSLNKENTPSYVMLMLEDGIIKNMQRIESFREWAIQDNKAAEGEVNE